MAISLAAGSWHCCLTTSKKLCTVVMPSYQHIINTSKIRQPVSIFVPSLKSLLYCKPSSEATRFEKANLYSKTQMQQPRKNATCTSIPRSAAI